MNIIRYIFKSCGTENCAPPLKVVVIGGGLGGLQAAKGLAKSNAIVTVVDKCANQVFQPLLFQVAGSVLDPNMIATPLKDLLGSQKNGSILKATVEAIDKVGKRVILSNGQALPYDYLIAAPGSRHSYFAHPEWEAQAPGLKTVDDALRIREVIAQAFRRSELSATRKKAIEQLRFVVIGGGPTGVELAGSIARIVSQSKHKIKPQEAEIYLVEGNQCVLPSYPRDLSVIAQKNLRSLGVKVILNQRVTDVAPDKVRLGNGKTIETCNIIWAAGNTAPRFLLTLDVPSDPQGRIIVRPDLTIPGHPEVFVIGDAAHARGSDGCPLPGLAPVAMQQGAYAAALIKKQTAPEKRAPFRYSDRGIIAIIGRMKAVMKVGCLRLSGFFAWLIWSAVHLFYVNGWRNRISVLNRWARSPAMNLSK